MSGGMAAAGGSNSTANDWAIWMKDRLRKEMEGHVEPAAVNRPQHTIFRVPKEVMKPLDEKYVHHFKPQIISLGLFHRPGRHHRAPQKGEELKLRMASAFLISIYTNQCRDVPQANGALKRLMWDPEFEQEFPGGVLSVANSRGISAERLIVNFLTDSRRDRVWRDLCHHVVGLGPDRSAGQGTDFWKEIVDCYHSEGDDHVKGDEPLDVLKSAITLDAILLGCYTSIRWNDKTAFPFPLVKRCVEQDRQSYRSIFKDLIKLENQIPLKLLENVLNILWIDRGTNSMEAKKMLNVVCGSFVESCVFHFPGFDSSTFVDDGELLRTKKFLDCDHLLGCVALALSQPTENNRRATAQHSSPGRGSSWPWIPSNVAEGVTRFRDSLCGATTSVNTSGLCGMTRNCFGRCSSRRSSPNIPKFTTFRIPTATLLHQAGIYVQGCPRGRGAGLLPVFEQGWITGTLYIPKLPEHIIYLVTWTLWRNVVPYECQRSSQESQLHAFLVLMDCLVDTKEDVLLLRKGDNPVFPEGCIETPDTLAETFNKINVGHKAVTYPQWIALADQIGNYQKRKYRRMFLDFVRANFGKPWLVISVLAATLLLILTFLQAIFSMLSYYH